ncbi:MAG: hypothetical protein BroJett011_42640 [Chloroflexota bacterium]|nr:MAG: hypothetical protein BroJett011_42640 [Chloroflexota bacterium]
MRRQQKSEKSKRTDWRNQLLLVGDELFLEQQRQKQQSQLPPQPETAVPVGTTGASGQSNPPSRQWRPRLGWIVLLGVAGLVIASSLLWRYLTEPYIPR